MKLIQVQRDRAHLVQLAHRLQAWLVADLNKPAEGIDRPPAFTTSRARALLRGSELLDEPTWNDFQRLVETEGGLRMALYDLIDSSGIGEHEEVVALAQVNAQSTVAEEEQAPADWLPIAVAAFAWKRQYPLYQLDPASPPETHSPAGQILRQTAHFLRQQVQRSATDRERLVNRLIFHAGALQATLETLQADQPIAPLPPHFRPPIPVRYPEYARDPVEVRPEDVDQPPAQANRLVITEEDLAPAPRSDQPTRMPEIQITRDQLEPEPARPPSPLPPSAVVMPAPSSATSSRSSLAVSLRSMFQSEELKTTKLRVMVQEYPDGPGLYGLQVKVSCKGIKSFVAGTTNREGNFVAELPVRLTEGLTYDVDVTWPRELDGETERKSVTLNADRTEFRLPFYRHLNPPNTE